MKESGPVVVRAFRDLGEAAVAQGLLRAHGIDARLLDDKLVAINWLFSNAIGGVKLIVAADEAERARLLLDTPAEPEEN